MIKKIPAGTCIYLTRKKNFTLNIQPDKTLVNDNLYVAYDVKVDGITVIPKGTRIQGDWVAESRPTLAAQLQINRIFLDRMGQEIIGDSDVIQDTTVFNRHEVSNLPYIYKIRRYRSSSNLPRRITVLNNRIKTLPDNNLNSVYLSIDTKEIPVYLNMDFIPFPNLQ